MTNCAGCGPKKERVIVLDERGNNYSSRRTSSGELIVTIPRVKESTRVNNAVTIGTEGVFVNELHTDRQSILFEVSPLDVILEADTPNLIWQSVVAVEHLGGCLTDYKVWVEFYTVAYEFIPVDNFTQVDITLERAVNNGEWEAVAIFRGNRGFILNGSFGTEFGLLQCEDGCCDESSAPPLVSVEYRLSAISDVAGQLVIDRSYGKLFNERIGK